MYSSKEDVMRAAAVFIILNIKKKREHKYWVRPSLKSRKVHGGIELLKSLRTNDLLGGHVKDGNIRNFLRMTDSDFERLLNQVGPKIKKTDTIFRKAITNTERLLITLIFLATGDSYASLMYLFRISKQAISKIVPDVCIAICEVLEDQIKIKRAKMEKYVSSLGATSKVLPNTQLLQTYNQERQPSVTRCQSNEDDPKDREWVSCPLCAIEVPRRFINEHYKSDKHKINAKIADVALERVQKLLHYNTISDIDKTESLYFCPQCVISLDPKDRQSHEKTIVHKKALTVDKFLYDFYVLYANDDRKSDIARECEATVVVKSNDIEPINEIVNIPRNIDSTLSNIREKIAVKTDDNIVNSNKNAINSDPLTKHQINDSKIIKVEETPNIPIKSEVNNSKPYDDSQFCTFGTNKNQIYCKICKVYIPNSLRNVNSHQNGFKHKEALRMLKNPL